MSGHANSDDYGRDIVCAAASIMAFTLINYLLDIEDSPNYKIIEGETPLISLNIESENIYGRKDIQNGFKFFDIGVRSLVDSYGNFVELTYQEVEAC